MPLQSKTGKLGPNPIDIQSAQKSSDLNQQIHCHVEDVHTKLDEIYGWFTSNLKNRTTNFDVPRQSFTSQEDVSLGPTFSLYMESPNNNNIVPICENVRFDPEWLQNSTNQRVFKCQCNSTGTAYGSGHQEHLACYSCMHARIIPLRNLRLIKFHSIPDEPDYPFEWTLPIVEDLAILSPNIQNYFFGDTKDSAVAYVSDFKLSASGILTRTRNGPP